MYIFPLDADFEPLIPFADEKKNWMVNAVVQNGDRWDDAYRKSFRHVSYPIILFDHDLTFLWGNDAAQKLFGTLPMREAVEQFIFKHEYSTFFDLFRQDTPVYVAATGILENSYDYLLTPVLEDTLLAGGTITLTPHNAASSALHPEGAQGVLATFSHQMRTPLTTIFSALSGVLRANMQLEDPDIREYAKTISAQCYRLLRSSISMAELYRWQNGLTEFCPKKQDLCQLSGQLFPIIAPLLQRVGAHLEFHLPDSPLITLFDPDRLSMVLLELVSNAAKFLGEQGVVQVSLARGSHSAIFTVSDNGLGMNESTLRRALEPYFSYDPKSGDICGDGLGLTISQNIVLEHGGTLAISSREGEGTQVTFSLPLRDDDSLTLSVNDIVADYLYNHFSNLFVILSDVCKPPESFDFW